MALDRVPLLEVTPEQLDHIQLIASERDFENAEEYLWALIEGDEEIDADDPEQDAIDFEAEFREAWGDAMIGNTVPIDEVEIH